MSDDLLDMAGLSSVAGRDWRTPIVWHGTPYRKTYYDWIRRCYRTDICILVGTRQEAPGVAWADRHGNQGKGAPPTIPRRDLSPQGARYEAHKRMGNRTVRVEGLAGKLRAYLKRNPGANLIEIYAALPDHTPDSIRATLSKGSAFERVGDAPYKGRRSGDDSRWRLRGGGT